MQALASVLAIALYLLVVAGIPLLLWEFVYAAAAPVRRWFWRLTFPTRLTILTHEWFLALAASLIWWGQKYAAWDGVFLLLLLALGIGQLSLLPDE